MAERTFRQAEVWRRAHAWVLKVYAVTARFPAHELFGLTAQLRRAAVSIPGNFAEGYSRPSALDKRRYYEISQSSASESQYYLLLAADLGYADTQALSEELDIVTRMLRAYTQSMMKNARAGCGRPSSSSY
jgi:four helix bundle protein